MKRGYIFIMVALLALVGCSKSDGVESSQSGELRITSSISTRASGTSWDDGDKIGVYMAESGTTTYLGKENTLYSSTSDGSNVSFESNSPLYYPTTGDVDILAYYPYSDAEEFDVTAYEVDVADQNDLTEIDLMIATKSKIASTSQALALNFEHKLSQINLTIKLSDGTALDLTKMSVKLIGTSATATYDLTADDSSPISNLSTTTEITLETNSNGTACEAIVIPQSLSGAMLLFDFESGESLAATITTTSFAIGQSYSYTATLSHAAVNLSSAEIGEWKEGNGEGEDLNAEQFYDIMLIDGVYNIYTAAGLSEFASIVNNGDTDINALLMNDIDLKNEEWTPIGDIDNNYSGTFNGGGYTVSNLTICCREDDVSGDYQGLFGYVYGGNILNLILENSQIDGGIYTGAVCGYIKSGTLSECRVSGGYVTGSYFSYSSASIVYLGGVVGFVSNNSSVTSCYNTGNVSATTANQIRIGGVAGFASSLITLCYNTGDVSGTSTDYSVRAGGVVGFSESSSATFCYNTGDVSGISTSSVSSTSSGGVMGYSSFSSVTSCYNTGCVSGSSTYAFYAGGVLGYGFYSYTITSCYFIDQANDAADYGVGNDTSSSYDYMKLTTVSELNEKINTMNTAAGSSTYFVEDSGNMNEGYPVLSWQVIVE